MLRCAAGELLCVALVACDNAGTTYTLPGGTICAPYAFTATLPAGVTAPPATVTGISGQPPSLTLTSLTLGGTPGWNEFGTWSIKASGLTGVTGWLVADTWSGTGTLAIPAPTIVPAPPTATNPGFAQISNTITLTVAPPCAYTITYAFSPYGSGQRFKVDKPSPLTTDATGAVDIVVAAETDLPRTTTLNFTITSIAPSSPTATASIAVIKQ